MTRPIDQTKADRQRKIDLQVGRQQLTALMETNIERQVLKGEVTGDWSGGGLFDGVTSAVQYGGRFK
jgi:hypothetical protein